MVNARSSLVYHQLSRLFFDQVSLDIFDKYSVQCVVWDWSHFQLHYIDGSLAPSFCSFKWATFSCSFVFNVLLLLSIDHLTFIMFYW